MATTVVQWGCAVLRLAHARTCAWARRHGNASLGPQELGWCIHRCVRQWPVQHVASWDLAGAAVRRRACTGANPGWGLFGCPRMLSMATGRHLVGSWPSKPCSQALEPATRPVAAKKCACLCPLPTARKVLVSTIIRIVRSFDRSLRYNVGSYVCRII